MATDLAAEGQTASDTSGIGGHPSGLSTLFFTEMWERFSYYGMRALLTLYMTKSLAEGGLAFDEKHASMIYATYVSSVWYLPLIGGWLADRILGARRATLIGAIVIACGHYSMAIDALPAFYIGLILIACGTGLLKPNISAMVGQLYKQGDQRRDAGFSIFYMGINLGAFFSPFVTGFLAQHELSRRFIVSLGLNPNNSWHWGFGAAGVGMTLGVIQYVIGRRRLSHVGLKPERRERSEAAAEPESTDYVTWGLAVAGAVIGGAGGLYFGDAGFLSALFPCVVLFWIGYLAGTARLLKGDELRRILVIFILFVFSIIFWMTFEQAGSSLTLFADRLTRNAILGQSFPSSWFQSVQPFFVWTLAPVFAVIWQRMGERQPSSPAKFALGLLFAGIAFVIISIASLLTGGGLVSPLWLVVVYLFQSFGELCLSPVGLSAVTKLAPARMVGLMMGVWFLSISIGSYIAGRTTELFQGSTPGMLARAFAIFAAITLVAALVLAALTPLIKKLTPRTE